MSERVEIAAVRDGDGFLRVASQDESRRIDQATITGGWGDPPAPPIPSRVLMELAGAGAARLIRMRAGGLPAKAVVLCGPGNNGGDGFVVARHLHAAGWTVRCVLLGAPTTADAIANRDLWRALGGEERIAERHPSSEGERSAATARMKNWLGHANAIVDGLFGTGLARPLDGAAADLVAAANAADHGLRIALDVPSGIDADRGAVLGVAFRADLTVTFGLPKLGCYLGAGPDHAGEVVALDIGWAGPAIAAVGTSARLADRSALARFVPRRDPGGHKGTFGHVGVIGGFAGTEGAAVLAARGAFRAGAGLVTWVGEPGPEVIERPAELMRQALGDALPERLGALVVGPGLGLREASSRALALALADERPAVLDADALNMCARDGAIAAIGRAGPRVLTPHPLEASRLIGVDVAAIQADRLGAAGALADRSGAVAVLKGRNPIVAAPGRAPVIFDLAEPTLAVGGSGDVLAGLVGALLGQGLAPFAAALLAVHLHGEAGRRAGLGRAQRGALASEIADEVPAILAALEIG